MKVAKLDRSKLTKEQSVYMPVIPEIAKCPEHLMPLKQWEDEFLADFSKLRLVCPILYHYFLLLPYLSSFGALFSNKTCELALGNEEI